MHRKAGIIFAVVVGVTGLFCLLLATILGFAVIPNIIDKKIEEQVTLEEGTETWDKWKTNPVPVYFRAYIWNVTNPDFDGIQTGDIPELNEVGPYVYRETREKHNIIVHPESDTIEYQNSVTYRFDRELSCAECDENAENLYVVNTPFVSASMGIYRKAPTLGPFFIDEVLVRQEGERFVTKPVSARQMIFDGFNLSLAYETIIGLLPDKPVEFTGNKFAFYNQRNASIEKEVYKIKAGKEDSSDFGRIIEWGGKLILDHWEVPDWLTNATNRYVQSSYCNMINGTDGTVFRPFIRKDTVLRIYQTEVCRSLYVTYFESAEHMGIPGYKFTMPDEFYDWPYDNVDNWCFCNTPPSSGIGNYTVETGCSKGVIRLGPCKYDSPVVTSNPHFHNAEANYTNKVHGMNPDPSFHKTTILVEPNSGSMLQISKKLQINVEMQRLHGVNYFSKVDHFLWPAFWVEEFVELDEYYTDDLKSKLLNPIKLVKILKWTVLGIGGLLIGIAAVVLISAMKKSKEYV